MQRSFGYWLKHRRKALDLTQAELADRVGCSAAAIRKIEAEERRPSAQIVQRLAEILNLPPHEQPAFLRFARGEMQLAPVASEEEFPWQTSTRPTPSNLPATVTSLIGREQEILRAREYLLNPNIRLISLVGPPGIGKTRLSIEAGRAVLTDFPDGVFFVALAPLDDPSLLVLNVTQALGYIEMKRQPAREQLIDSIGNKKMLMVLDNCEHLIENVALLASDLLSACSRLKILTTSREALRIPGEWVYAIPTLNVPKDSSSVNMETASAFPALTLFAERARAVHSEFTLCADNLQAVASICNKLDGLPLAIELMAARMRLMTPQNLLEQLNNEFLLSVKGMRTLSPRQKTLNDAIRWSYNLLTQEEQRVFAYLSVFSGGFTLDAAEGVFSELFPVEALSDLITSLLDKSLVQRVFDAHGASRFNMLVTIQQLARKELHSLDQAAELRNRHLTYFLNLAEQADQELRGPNQVEWLSRLTAERDNLRSALEWVIETRQTETALHLVRKLDWFWFVRSDHTEGRQWLTRSLALNDASLYTEAFAHALAQLAHHAWLQVGAKEARAPAEQALSLARTHNDTWNTARALAIVGLVLTDEGNYSEAQKVLEESKSLYQEVHDHWGYAHAVTCLGQAHRHQGDQAAALSYRKQALLLFKELGDRYFESATLGYIGMVQVMQGNITQGIGALRESLILAQQIDSKYEIAMFLTNFAQVAQITNDLERSVRLSLAAKNIYDSIGAWHESDRARIESILMPCRSALGEEIFAVAEAKGRGMTIEQAIDYALEEQL